MFPIDIPNLEPSSRRALRCPNGLRPDLRVAPGRADEFRLRLRKDQFLQRLLGVE
jgi:hypothetical protein